MQTLAGSLKELLDKLPPRPVSKPALDELVKNTLLNINIKTSAENRKNQCEYLLRNEIFTLAAKEGAALKDPATKYYDDLRDRLDLMLTFAEHDACEQVFPFHVLYDLLETQTIASCSHVFSWIEERADRLTEGMVPQKGKALVLLRTLNDLLRRLSKMGSTTMFCGRILTFLSRVFPLGERSGVNLRGEYGPPWEGPGAAEMDDPKPGKDDAGESAGDKMEVDESQDGVEVKAAATEANKKQAQKEDFYNTFWSLQIPFSRPTRFANPKMFPIFRAAVEKVLPVIKEATAKDRALMGSKTLHNTSASGSLKRKRDPEALSETTERDYFFARFLTSPELLDLEIADTHFRRQFLFQLLILLNHLLSFTKSAKATWSTNRNRSLQIEFTLESTDAQWVQDTVSKAIEELRQTAPSGRAFADTVHVVLEREKNWIKWKNELCAPFDKEPWATEVQVEDDDGRPVKRRVGLEEATREAREKMREEPKEWEHELGSEALSEIWAMGYRDLRDLEQVFNPGDVKDFTKKINLETNRIQARRRQIQDKLERLAQARERRAAQQREAAIANESPATPNPSQEGPAAPTTPHSAGRISGNSNTPSLAAAPTTPRSGPINAPVSNATPPLHPSLPAKPGTTPTVKASASHDSLASAPSTPIPTPVQAPVAAPVPAAAVTITEPLKEIEHVDDMIMACEQNKQRWAWLALRAARDQYLQHFGKIGTGDIELLAQEIEKEKVERERPAHSEEPAPANNNALSATGADDRGASPLVPTAATTGDSKPNDEDVQMSASQSAGTQDGEGDVKMEERP